ncbi:MAG: hypothetical protein CMK83_24330 [Pseudomonadales bacterium]|nr:hypothetical protein [Pseudomonadales bacterium]MEC8811762.1 LuxR C-terminal-related transcriptional regulator [Pseudomonadota bacterium]HAG93562.1 hypothetical protein [Gammaproteobacteria bacterium]HAU14151.1 hypothetical protein [Gammaproteobacteria bacterium]HCB40999.1 hypothetical protein [Gammaproteobacteria bacterium]|tara:strand:+ start:82653 stop:85247 length:2595 start_codon:yes stop_codon:yes gene_type:complete
MLLKTKFYAPPIRDNAIPRQRLLQRLGSPQPGQVTLIHAPAGYGKTTLAKQWLDTLGNPYYWLSLDPQDNEPQRFWRYVCAALGPDIADKAQAQSAEDHIIKLINYCQDCASKTLQVLVMDDFHCIQESHLMEQVSWFLDRLPRNLHIVITSRCLPQIHVPRRRVRHQLIEIAAQELCFQSTESERFLQQTLRLNLPADTIHALHNQTEGWAAALQLAGLSIKDDDSAQAQWLTRSRNQTMMDYLAEEVLASQPGSIQQFLLHVTQVRRFNLPLCEFALSDLPDCPVKESLQHLQQNNLFLIPLDEGGVWFRFHDLFRENIQSLARKLIPDSLRQFLRQSANWFMTAGDAEEAIYCLIQAQLWDDAADLIEELGVSRMLAGKNESLNWWLNRLPEHTITQRPKLALIKAWTLFCTERVTEAEPYLNQADQLLQGTDHAALRTQILVFRAHIARFRGDEENAAHWSALAMKQSAAQAQDLNAVTLFAMGLEQYQNGQTHHTRTYMEQALSAAYQEQNYFCALSVSIMLAHVYFQSGFTPKALVVLEETRHWLLQHGQCEAQLDHWQNILYVTIYRETRQLTKARQALHPLLQLQQEGAENGHSALINLMHAVILAGEGRWEEAFACTAAGENQMAQDQSHWSAMSPDPEMIRAILHLQKGDIAQALQWARDNEARLQGNLRFATEEERIILARCYALNGERDKALTLLEQIIDATTRQGRLINKTRALLTIAIVHSHHREWDAAADALLNAIRCAATAQYYQMFFDEHSFLQPALLRLQEQGHQGWWQAAIVNSAAENPLPEPLTNRELEVLNLIAVGHRNQAIADSLHIALTTTKAHIRHIYEKMAVQSRTQAVARGRELGLIQ